MRELSINPQGKIQKKMTLIQLYLSFGFKADAIRTRRVRSTFTDDDGEELYDEIKPVKMKVKGYKPVKISTGLSVPNAFWDNDKKVALGVYVDISAKQAPAFRFKLTPHFEQPFFA